MANEQAQRAKRLNSIVEKAAHSRAAQKRLAETEIRLAGVKAKIRAATLSGHIVVTQQLEYVQKAVDANLLAARSALESFRKSGDEEWAAHAREVDDAWEALSRSIKRLVSGYSEAKHER